MFLEFAWNAWEKRKLGELANIRRGASPRPIKSKKWFSQTSQVGWIRISDVTEQNGRIHQVEQHLSDAGQKKTLVLKSKHLLLSIAATVGKPVQNYIQVGVHDGFIVFMDPKFDLDFMFYFLEKYRPNWARFGQPGSQININSELVRDLVVSIPTVHEQDAVAQFIITLDNLIAATQRRINALEKIEEASSQYLFVQEWKFRGYSSPWKQVKLGEIADIIGGGTPKTDEPKFWNGEIDWYAPAEIGSNRYVSGSVRTITSVGLNKSSASILPANRTILFTSRAGIGNAAILKKDAATNQGFQSLVLKDGVDVYFMYSKIPEIKQKAIRIAAGSTFLEISGKKLSQIALLVPELNEQQRIGAFFKKLDDLIAANHSKVSRLNLLKRFLLQGLFI